MAVITPDTFNPLRRVVSVRLQSGVPIVDADDNERDDVRQFELRAYLKWFVGDGVPYGSDAFLISAAATPVVNDFVIEAGIAPAPPGTPDLYTGLRHVGRCLVDGLDATIRQDLGFRAQPLHVANPAAAEAAALRGTVTIPEVPTVPGTLLVYLDVWDRLLRADEDPSLIHVDVGTETCARLIREWAVRTRGATVVPLAGDADFEPGHSYYALASLARIAADPIVYPSQLEDLREQRLLTPPATIVEDLLGTNPERYRRGLDRPAISLRSAVNALLRGQLPSSQDFVIAPDPANDQATREVLRIGPETLVFWHSDRVSATDQVFVTSWPTSNPAAAAANAPIQVTSGPAAQLPSVVLLPTAPVPSLFVAYQTQNDIHFRRAATAAGLPAAAQAPVSTQAEPEEYPVAVRTGQFVTVLWYWNGPGANDRVRYRRRQYDATWTEAAAMWLDTETTDLSTIQPRNPTSVPGFMHAATDSSGRIWVAFETNSNNIAVARLTPSTGAIETWTNIELNSTTVDQQPFVLVDEPDTVWTFWRGDNAIYHRPLDIASNAWGTAAQVPGTTGLADANERPTALIDDDGGIWLLWSVEDATAVTDIWAVRRDRDTGGWGTPRQVTASTGSNDSGFAFIEGGAIQLFFRSNRAGQFDLYYKQLITTI